MSWSSSSFIFTRLTLILQLVVSTPLIRAVSEPTPGDGFLRRALTVASLGLYLTRCSRLSESVFTAQRSSPHLVAAAARVSERRPAATSAPSSSTPTTLETQRDPTVPCEFHED